MEFNAKVAKVSVTGNIMSTKVLGKEEAQIYIISMF